MSNISRSEWARWLQSCQRHVEMKDQAKKEAAMREYCDDCVDMEEQIKSGEWIPRAKVRELIVMALLEEWRQYRDDDWTCPMAERPKMAGDIADRLLAETEKER